MNKRWFHVEIYGTQSWGFASLNGVVTDAPPIAAWMIGKTLDQVRSYFLKNNAKVSEIKLHYDENI